MSGFTDAALEKLRKEAKDVTGQKEKAMASAVRATLESFCRQEAEFAQAVAQGGSFRDCMKAVAGGVGQSISDLDAYKKAVQFYFPGAEIRWTMTVDLVGAADSSSAGRADGFPSGESRGAGDLHGEDRKPAGIVLDFTQFL